MPNPIELNLLARALLGGSENPKRCATTIYHESDKAILSHRLQQRKDPNLKRRIERTARLYALCKDKDVARAERHILELLALCYEFFYVTGTDLDAGNSHDEVFASVVVSCIQRYNPDKSNASLVNYIAVSYRYRIRDEAKKMGIRKEGIQPSSSAPVQKGKGVIQVESLNAYELGEDRDSRLLDEEDNSEIVDDLSADTEISKDKYWEFLTLLYGFLNHKEDRGHRETSKILYRMVFSERITYAIKSQPRYEDNPHLEIIRRHERDTFGAVERGFFDSFFISSSEDYAKQILDEFMEKLGKSSHGGNDELRMQIAKYETGEKPLINLALTVLTTYMRDMKDEYRNKIDRLRDRIIAYEARGEKEPPRIAWLATDDYRNYLKSAYGIVYKKPEKSANNSNSCSDSLKATVSTFRRKFNAMERGLGR